MSLSISTSIYDYLGFGKQRFDFEDKSKISSIPQRMPPQRSLHSFEEGEWTLCLKYLHYCLRCILIFTCLFRFKWISRRMNEYSSMLYIDVYRMHMIETIYRYIYVCKDNQKKKKKRKKRKTKKEKKRKRYYISHTYICFILQTNLYQLKRYYYKRFCTSSRYSSSNCPTLAL